MKTSVRMWQQQRNSAFFFPFPWDVCCDKSQVTLFFSIFDRDTLAQEGIVFVCLQKQVLSNIDNTSQEEGSDSETSPSFL